MRLAQLGFFILYIFIYSLCLLIPHIPTENEMQ